MNDIPIYSKKMHSKKSHIPDSENKIFVQCKVCNRTGEIRNAENVNECDNCKGLGYMTFDGNLWEVQRLNYNLPFSKGGKK